MGISGYRENDFNYQLKSLLNTAKSNGYDLILNEKMFDGKDLNFKKIEEEKDIYALHISFCDNSEQRCEMNYEIYDKVSILSKDSVESLEKFLEENGSLKECNIDNDLRDNFHELMEIFFQGLGKDIDECYLLEEFYSFKCHFMRLNEDQIKNQKQNGYILETWFNYSANITGFIHIFKTNFHEFQKLSKNNVHVRTNGQFFK